MVNYCNIGSRGEKMTKKVMPNKAASVEKRAHEVILRKMTEACAEVNEMEGGHGHEKNQLLEPAIACYRLIDEKDFPITKEERKIVRKRFRMLAKGTPYLKKVLELGLI